LGPHFATQAVYLLLQLRSAVPVVLLKTALQADQVLLPLPFYTGYLFLMLLSQALQFSFVPFLSFLTFSSPFCFPLRFLLSGYHSLEVLNLFPQLVYLAFPFLPLLI